MIRTFAGIGFVLGLVSVVGGGLWLAAVLILLWITRTIGAHDDGGEDEA
ncbi:hypothetical protein [Streptomyces avicenniae]|nr:hypothetical protein [Streptomyces avicenniae]